MIRRVPTTSLFSVLSLLGTVSLLFSALSLVSSLFVGASPWAPIEACCTAAIAGFSIGWILIATIALVSLVTLARIAISIRQHLRASQSVRSLSRIASLETISGYRCLVLEETRPLAFCAGLFKPQIFVSRGLLVTLSAEETLAVLAHEEHHRHRRDPLRHAARKVLVEGFFLLPMLREFGMKCVERAEIDADRAAAAQNPGGSQALAKALLLLHGREGEVTSISVSPERLNGLAGESSDWTPSRSAAFTTLAALFALLAGPVAAVELVTGSQVGIQALGLHVCLVALIVAPLTLTAGLVWKTPTLKI